MPPVVPDLPLPPPLAPAWLSAPTTNHSRPPHGCSFQGRSPLRPLSCALRSARRHPPQHLAGSCPELLPVAFSLAAVFRAQHIAQWVFLKQFAAWANQNRTVVGVLVTATCIMYGFYRGSVYIMHFFFNVSDKQIFEIGFAGGILTALLVVGSGVYAQRYLTVNTSQVYRAAQARLRTHPLVEEKLGEFWRSSGFRGYKIESLKDAVQGSDRRARSTYLEAPSRRVQMIFMVHGIERSGMISCMAHKRSGTYHFDMLALDLLPAAGKPSEHLFLEGDQDQILFSELGMVLDATRASGRGEAKMADA